MNILVVLVGLVLVLCEGRIVAYRRPIHDSEEKESLEDFNDDSTEEIFEDPVRERQSKSRNLESSYGSSGNFNKRFESENEYKAKKPQYSSGRSRGKYSSYGKPPHKSYVKESPSKQNAYNAIVGDRKKDPRSIPRYEPSYQPYSAPIYKPVIHHRPLPPPPPPPPSYKPAAPKHSCQQNLLIGCTPTVTRVPCSGHANGYHSPQPFFGPAGTSYPEPAQHASYQSHAAASYNPPAPPAAAPAYQPYYKPPVYRATNNQPSKPIVPSFAHPVKEDTQDTGKQPFVSAFPKTTTAEPQLPTVPADRDQNFQLAESTAKPPAAGSTAAAEETHSHKEASGDEPEHTSPAPAPESDEEQ
ncbi:uncharacterized protein LOC129728353 [Wyeomyia smithii]|uniref:uncharacterized protein LOC129728353 n=1 Tax=Wyeomyia smithii TaxID=174621 RepID=UPI002467F7D6|nr:uncharacterized protein LOC129728353 [Wyeomyia smithii]